MTAIGTSGWAAESDRLLKGSLKRLPRFGPVMPGPLLGSRWRWKWGLGRCWCGLDGQDTLRGQCRGHGSRVHAGRQAVAAVELSSNESMFILGKKNGLERPTLLPSPAAPSGPLAYRALLMPCVDLHMVADHLDRDFLW